MGVWEGASGLGCMEAGEICCMENRPSQASGHDVTRGSVDGAPAWVRALGWVY